MTTIHTPLSLRVVEQLECGKGRKNDAEFAEEVVKALLNAGRDCDRMLPEVPVNTATPLGKLRRKLVPVHMKGWDELGIRLE